jgi:hypothetical protein
LLLPPFFLEVLQVIVLPLGLLNVRTIFIIFLVIGTVRVPRGGSPRLSEFTVLPLDLSVGTLLVIVVGQAARGVKIFHSTLSVSLRLEHHSGQFVPIIFIFLFLARLGTQSRC